MGIPSKLYYKDEKGRLREYKDPEPPFDNALYRKVQRGNRFYYEPCSMLMTNDLPEGVWVVAKHEYGRSMTSGKYMNDCYMCLKASDLQEVSLAKLGSMEKLAHYLSRHWSELPLNKSQYELCCAIVGLLFRFEEKNESKNG